MNKPFIAVVGDAPIITTNLHSRLAKLGYRITGPIPTGEEALRQFRQSSPDLVLVDVDLPGELDGIKTAEAIRRSSAVPIIFIAGTPDEATYNRARAVRPSAYLYKPYPDRDLVHAVDLALAAPVTTASAVTDAPTELPDGESAMLHHDRLFLKMKDRLCRIMLDDILWVEADDYYCKVVTEEREYLVTKTLKKFSAMLPPESTFVRCHRSYLVNLRRITEIGEVFVLVGAHKLPVSRSRRAELMQRVSGNH